MDPLKFIKSSEDKKREEKKGEKAEARERGKRKGEKWIESGEAENESRGRTLRER